MNYIVLNGMKSTLIKGLLISELPPITKPLIRTKTEEIDGRDGDIVTKVGYAAYDKKMTIGLYGDYDIDEVIEYFNSSGEVLFSNEPDKIYRYQINNAIDFDRLLRFRTATVVFHVQPFKYSALNDSVFYSKNMLIYNAHSWTVQDVTIDVAKRGIITVDGETDMSITVKMFDTDKITLKAGVTYTFTVDVVSSASSSVGIAIAKDVDGVFTRLGDQIFWLGNDVSFSYTPEEDETYDKIEINVSFMYNGTTQFKPKLTSSETVSNIVIPNRGNVVARPTIKVTGTGAATLQMNNGFTVSISEIALSGESWQVPEMTLDVESMNATTVGQMGETVMRNRDITGDIRNLEVPVGRNILHFTGSGIETIEIERGARWV
jgi:predicted phage tail component-like protein